MESCRDKKFIPIFAIQKYKNMPTLLNIFGLRFYFYSDEHEPIHVHIENSDGKAKINLLPLVEVVENRNIKLKDVKKALAVIDLYKEEFISVWYEYHGNE
jgi:hypothetical protein